MSFSVASLLLLGLPFLANCALVARDDSSEGGGDPGAGSTPGSTSGLSNWEGHPGVAPVPPTKDGFYVNATTNITEYKNGDIIDQRPIGLAGTYQGIDSAYQIRIKSEDAHNSPVVSFAAVLIPRASHSNGNAVVYTMAEEANTMDCAPTFQLFSRQVNPEIQALIGEGFTVIVPDYEGTRGSFTVGKLEGKQILDAARAALTVPGVKSANGTSTNVGIWGYGTAAHAAGWAAELASTYAPEIPIKGVALGGVVSNLMDWINSINNGPYAGGVVNSLLGMASEYKDVNDVLNDNVVAHHRTQFEAAASRCAGANVLHFFNANVTSQFFTPGVNIFQIPKVSKLYDLNSLGKTAPKTNLYVYQGTADTVAPISDVRTLLKGYCNAGTSVKYREVPGASHNQVKAEYEDVIDYFSNALAGAVPANTCERITSGDYY